MVTYNIYPEIVFFFKTGIYIYAKERVKIFGFQGKARYNQFRRLPIRSKYNKQHQDRFSCKFFSQIEKAGNKL